MLEASKNCKCGYNRRKQDDIFGKAGGAAPEGRPFPGGACVPAGGLPSGGFQMGERPDPAGSGEGGGLEPAVRGVAGLPAEGGAGSAGGPAAGACRPARTGKASAPGEPGGGAAGAGAEPGRCAEDGAGNRAVHRVTDGVDPAGGAQREQLVCPGRSAGGGRGPVRAACAGGGGGGAAGR